jgi:hypothetical protein
MEVQTEKRSFARAPYKDRLDFIVLLTKGANLQKIPSDGSIIDVSESGLGITTEFPLEPGYVLEWDDKHQKGKLHIALVKWVKQQGNLFRAGLLFI